MSCAPVRALDRKILARAKVIPADSLDLPWSGRLRRGPQAVVPLETRAQAEAGQP